MKGARELYRDLGFGGNPVRGRDDYRLLLEAIQNGNNRTLKDVLPADLYEHFVALRQKYTNGEESFETLRPIWAVEQLRRSALRNLKLQSDGGVKGTMDRLARRSRVKVRSLAQRDDESARDGIAKLAAIPRETDIPCFAAQLDKLESAIEEAAIRANAWSTGDIATLRESFKRSGASSTNVACDDFFRLTGLFWTGWVETNELADGALRNALDKNPSTVAMVSITELLDAKGILARFRADGYDVEEP